MSDPRRPHGTLLGGQVRYDQPHGGYRTGIEPVLLAAAIDARAGQWVVEAGTGAGAALLCLALRLNAVSGVGIERDPALTTLAAANIAVNGYSPRLRVVTADLLTLDRAALGRPSGFDHALANPPWHDPAGPASADPARDGAKRATPGLLAAWAAHLAGLLRHRGTLSLIIPAAQLDAAVPACANAGCGSIQLTPFWPRAGVPAKLLLVQAIRGGRGPTRLLPGLILHPSATDEPGYTKAATHVLQHGRSLASLADQARPAPGN